jgi:hypothetical protein
LAVIALAAGDVAVLGPALQVLGENEVVTRLLAATIAGAVAFAGWFVGQDLLRARFGDDHDTRHRPLGALALIAVAGVVAATIGLAVVRDAYLGAALASAGLAVPTWAVVLAQLPILLAAVLVGYLHANAFLDDVDHSWARACRAHRRVRRAHRRHARAIARHHAAWHERRSVIGAYLEVAAAHTHRARADARSWLADQGVVTLGDAALERVRGPAEPTWVERFRRLRAWTGDPADDTGEPIVAAQPPERMPSMFPASVPEHHHGPEPAPAPTSPADDGELTAPSDR